jgi:hypothetical protein
MIEPKKLEPGSELHFALLGTPMGWNFLTGKDYADMQAFAKAVWDAATERAAKKLEALRDDHCKGTRMAPDKSDWCDPDDGACEFVTAWNDGIAAIRATGGEG